MRIILGLASDAPESGKSTSADILQREFGFVIHSFAAPLRDEVARSLLYPAPEHFPDHIRHIITRFHRNLEAVYTKPLDPEMRILQQWWGTEYRRAQDPDYWVKLAAMKIPEFGRVVFDDLRFSNEYQLIVLLSGEVWKVRNDRANEAYLRFLESAGSKQHASEQWARNFTGFDSYIGNDGSIAELHNTICTTAIRRFPQLLEVAA